ncbi:winged helix-turn-helix domain-containing protein [Falsiroseomonas sp.]|uniref:winged helix-turn-helix domain-containing protein n=1 Tax=Falsiroseomonas sp. TaxID=2870721 RepID=UPI0034A1549A
MARMTRAESEDRPAGRLRIRILLAAGEPFGPGKAELLEAIRDTGSIAAAGRRMGMSYQRAWDLVAAMNAHFREPVVAAAKGGARGGGTALTPFGVEILAAYREIEALAAEATAEKLDWLRRQLAPG